MGTATRKAVRLERKVLELAFSKHSEAQLERRRMTNERQWAGRTSNPGQFWLPNQSKRITAK